VFGDVGLIEAGFVDEFRHRQLPLEENVEDREAGGLGKHREALG